MSTEGVVPGSGQGGSRCLIQTIGFPVDASSPLARESVSASSAVLGITETASNAALEEVKGLGGIDLSQIELTLKDEKFISSLNPADLKVLRAAKALKDEWESLSLLYIHEIILLLKDNLIKDLQNRDLLFGILNQLKLKEFLDPQALNFLNFLHSQKPLSEIKLTLVN